MQSKSRTFTRGDRVCRYRYCAALPFKSRPKQWMTSKPYVDLSAARRLLKRIEGHFRGAVLMRTREWLDDDGGVVKREREIEKNGRWVREEHSGDVEG